jgi:acyl-coenzyme A synthetase/AMP-(fatty) acid ligase
MLLDKITEWARIQPTRPALVHNDDIYDYSYFARSIALTRNLLRRHDLPPGATAIILVWNLFECWRLMIALRSLGLDTIVVSSLEQMNALQIRNAACLVVTAFGYRFYKIGEQELPALDVVVVPHVGDAQVQQADFADGTDARPFGGHILYTSGTTGSYKKLKVDGTTEEKRNLARARAFAVDAHTVSHTTDHGPWTQVGFRMPSAIWHSGGCVVFSQLTPDNPKVCDLSRFFRHAVNFSILLPWQLNELVQSEPALERLHDECRLHVTAGFLPAALAEKAIRKISNNLSAYYGSTELCTPALLSRYENTESLQWLAPVNERVVEVVDQAGRACATGQQGQVRIRREAIDCTGYLDDEEASARHFRDGYFYPGDMGMQRADGRIRILGRVSDVINVRGDKIAVGPLEQSIGRVLQIDDVCLFNHLNDAGEEELLVAIETDRKPQAAALDEVSDRYLDFERIRFTCLREFPRTQTGTRKVRRAELKALILADGAKEKPLFETEWRDKRGAGAKPSDSANPSPKPPPRSFD